MASVEAVGRLFNGGQKALASAGPASGAPPTSPATPGSTGGAGTIAAPAGSGTVIKKESGMSTINQDLSGDDIKNVRYSILFTKRDLEGTLKPATDEVINYSTDGASYGALKLSE